jgi:hypothetical protein
MIRPDDDVLYPNGVDPDGHLAWRPVRLDDVGEPPPDARATDDADDETYRRARYGVSEENLDEAGWGIVAPPGYEREIAQLAPLIELRRQQAARAYRQPTLLRRGEEVDDFYRRLAVAPGAASPQELPHYLLVLGAPHELSFGAQQVIGQARAVGRLHFERPEDYGIYAENVVAAEERPRRGRPQATFFAAVNGEDRATRRTRDDLVSPLADDVEAAQPAWRVRRLAGDDATKPRLLSLLTDEAPPLLFTATHGLAPRFGDPTQRERQGAPISSEWQGHGHPCGPECYLTGGELPGELGLAGGIVFLFACFGAGTPSHDGFWFKSDPPEPRRTAEPPFVSRLVQGLLSRRGGPAAVIGHVDRAWTCSFSWHRGGQTRGFTDALRCLMDGGRVGPALGWMLELYRNAATGLEEMGGRRDAGMTHDPHLLTRFRLAAADARNFVVCGDPAVRLPVD